MTDDRYPRTPSGPERQITGLGLVFAVCTVLAAAMLGYWALVRGPELTSRDDNPRWIEQERRIRRGDILDRHGHPLASSESVRARIWRRVYLVPEAAPVVGYASIFLGTGGIEDAYNAQLRGANTGNTPATLIGRIEADLRPQARIGEPVKLTIDRDLQLAASEALAGQTGAVVLMDVRTGDLWAMASQPTFDPNQLEEQWTSLAYSPEKPMLNRAAQGLYPPGAIFQTVTLTAAVQQGIARPDTVYRDASGIVLAADPPISCPGDPPALSFTLSEAYQWPCSVVFARLGIEMGLTRLEEAAQQLGMGQTSGLPIKVSTRPLLRGDAPRTTAIGLAAMGQGTVLVTPLEMALVLSTVANDGQRPTPRLVLSVGGSPTSGPTLHPVLHPESAHMVHQVLVDAYQAGAAGKALPQDGIAGTARAAASGVTGAPDHAWFVGYAPADAPRFAVAVIVEHGADGWAIAAPIGLQMLELAQRTG